MCEMEMGDLKELNCSVRSRIIHKYMIIARSRSYTATLQAGVIQPTSSITIRCQVWQFISMESLDTLRPSSGVDPDWVCMISWYMYL